ncbi:MAG: mechanosensitive ion channel family protein, partial [Deltaproteobacteria bacterium]|nr:mechanosensitive ion channel family protein [Deltaproteobacteria bacterium]
MQKVIFSLLTVLAAYILSMLIIRLINRQIKDLKRKYTARKTIVYIISFLAILIIIV